jgi:hypothetical protein
MIPILKRTLSLGLAFSCGLVSLSSGIAQTVSAPQKHLGSGPIDLNNLSDDILNCEVCRQRLGLPPLNAALPMPQRVNSVNPTPTQTNPQSSPTAPQPMMRVLGSPGMLSSTPLGGNIFEEFTPPQPEPGAIRLGEIPPEVRQQFMRSLELPHGAKIMSAEIMGQKKETSNSDTNTAKPSVNSATPALTLPAPKQPAAPMNSTLGAPGIRTLIEPKLEVNNAGAKSALEPTQNALSTPTAPPVPEQPTTPARASADLPTPTSAIATANNTTATLEASKELLAKKLEAEQQAKQVDELRAQLAQSSALMEKMQTESMKRLEQVENANKESLRLLEKRAAEMTEMQLKLEAEQKQVVQLQKDLQAKEQSKATDKPEHKKPAKGKGKKSEKSSVDL